LISRNITHRQSSASNANRCET